MNSLPTLDLSLYQLALDNLTTPQSLSISPVGLKTLVGAMVDVLIEEKVPATIWVKSPSVAGWREELLRYRQQIGIPQTLYWCNCFGEASDAVATQDEPRVNPDAQLFPIQLAAGSQLKRESFLLVLCEQLTSLIVAYQRLEGESPYQSQSWLTICTFERRVIYQVLQGLRGSIAIADSTPDELLAGGKNPFSLVRATDEKILITQVLIKQLQRTEEILQSRTMAESGQNSAITQLTHHLSHKDELLRRVAQELKTPLTNMKTALSLLESHQLKPAQRQRYMQLLNSECDRQNSLIVGLLDLVEADEPQPRVKSVVELAQILPGVVSTYQPLAQEKGIQLGYTIPADLPSVSCRETWLRQIAINLLHNSLKFTPPGGQVKVLGSLQGEYVQLAFTDTGSGIAASEIPKIFDSFYRGRPIPGEEMGAGLGLTIVQQLLLRCGGSISVKSQVGKGATFKVLLPVTDCCAN
ncbi:MAG: DICT sensory domain-containing protein [Coleofasciculus sp. G1-WW12-02]|uniref:DICT sensory domain-containing protein n=1 Tax=Coleofasciculus sp. G1-WW12-02 TaxID=3068483 RepID=UPI0032F3E9B6